MTTYFEWDENKNRKNRAKHGVAFQPAKLVFEDPNLILAGTARSKANNVGTQSVTPTPF